MKKMAVEDVSHTNSCSGYVFAGKQGNGAGTTASEPPNATAHSQETRRGSVSTKLAKQHIVSEAADARAHGGGRKQVSSKTHDTQTAGNETSPGWKLLPSCRHGNTNQRHREASRGTRGMG